MIWGKKAKQALWKDHISDSDSASSNSDEVDSEEEERILKKKLAALKARRKKKPDSKPKRVDPRIQKLEEIEQRKLKERSQQNVPF